LRKEAAETEVEIEQVSSEEDNDDEKDQEAWPSGSSDDDIPIRFPRVKFWFKCPICLSNMYEHKNNVLFYINNFIAKEMGRPTWSKSIASFPGCSKHTCVTCDDHELYMLG
jgi:hypothetical protein